MNQKACTVFFTPKIQDHKAHLYDTRIEKHRTTLLQMGNCEKITELILLNPQGVW